MQPTEPTKDSGFESMPMAHHETQVKELPNKMLSRPYSTSSAPSVEETKENAITNINDQQQRWMEEELQSKTQEILKLQETLRRQEEQKEDISKLLESSKRQIDAHGTGRVEVESAEKSSGTLPPGYNFEDVGRKQDRPTLSPSLTVPYIAQEEEHKSAEQIEQTDVDMTTRELPLETKLWYSDRNHISNPIIECDSFFPVTLKNFGLSVFDEDSGDLLTHIEEVNRCAEEAGEMGATELQKIRLLMLSLPKELKYVENFIPPEKKSKYEDYSGELVRILGDKIRVAMNNFLNAQRGSEESILIYFNRIALLYKNGNALVGTDWEMDSGHVTAIYTKIYQALSDEEKQALDMHLDNKLEMQKLTMAELRKVLLDIYKLKKRSSTNQALIKSLHLSIMPPTMPPEPNE